MVTPAHPPVVRAGTRVSLSPTELVATDDRLRASRGGDPLWRAELTPPQAEGVAWPSLAAALRELASVIGSPGALEIALLPPLTEVRRLELPPLREDERLRLLSRTAGRHFLSVRESSVVGMAPTAKAKQANVVAAAVPSRLLAALHMEAAATGWTVHNVVPAHAAWMNAAVQMWPVFARGHGSLLVVHGDHVELLQSEMGRLAGVRRFRDGSTDLDELVAVIGTGGISRVAAIGVDETRRELVRELAARGVSLLPPPDAWSGAAASPSSAAATFLAANERFRLRTDDAVALRNMRVQRTATRLVAVATLFLGAAAAIDWWGVRRELAHVLEQRAAIAPQVRQLLDGQQASSVTSRRFQAIADAHRAVPQWSLAIADLSAHLDEGAHLFTLRARGDTIQLDGLAARSNDVFESVERAPNFSAVRAAGEMRVERQDDGTLLERFTIQAMVSRPGGAR